MPQNLSSEWHDALGAAAVEVHQNYLHSLGNLTLVTQEWNSILSNSAFNIKRDKLSNHALLINNQYFSEDTLSWNETEIIHRADFLAQQFLQVWPSLAVRISHQHY